MISDCRNVQCIRVEEVQKSAPLGVHKMHCDIHMHTHIHIVHEILMNKVQLQ